MAIGDSVQRYPLLRLLVSYICGIAIADGVYPLCGNLLKYALWGCLLAILAMIGVYAIRHRVAQMVYGVAAMFMFLSLGGASYVVSRDRVSYEWLSDACVYEAKVMELPRSGERSTRCMMLVRAVSDSSQWHAVDRKVLVYMPLAIGDSLLPGDVVCFRSKVHPPQNFSDDLNFDYAHYVTMQGASGTTYVPEHQCVRVGEEELSLRERLLRFSHRLQTKYMHTAFSKDGLGVLAALTLGDKRMLSDEVRAVYTDAGAAHVLALSGLHVGVIYAMLTFVIRGVVRKRNMRWLRDLLVVVVLWLFALMVGMSASVVRAVAMCTLYILARWVGGDSSSINTLSLAALLMLLVRPFYLFDVGFQLSYMAMAAILWIEPYIERAFYKHSLPRVPAYFIGIICMSLAAQLGTFPLTLYHFGTFPSFFLLTNLLVIPFLSIILSLMLLWWILVLAGMPLSVPLGQFLQYLTEGMNGCLACIGEWPGAVLHVMHYNLLSVVFTYLIVLFLGLFVVKKWSRGLIFALGALLGLLVSFLL